jgi:predicted nucleotidyltransferase
MLNRLRDVFKSFQQHEVKYVVIGGIASVLHGVPRATFDLDILIEATPQNAERLLQALLDAGLIPILNEISVSRRDDLEVLGQ